MEIRATIQTAVPAFPVYASGEVTAPSFHDAFVELFGAQFDRVHRVIQRLSGDSDLASDLVQDAFVRLYRRGSMPDVPAAWLITVTLNLHRNATSMRQRRRRLLTIGRGEHVHSDPAPLPDRALVEESTRSDVRAALRHLSDRDQQMLLMRAEGYSYREIAQALDVQETSVGTFLARAVRSFREHYHANDATP